MGELTILDRLRAWLVTGPLARGLAFFLEFSVALGRWAAGKRSR